ncbi:MAG TPA: sodium:solute symporter family protein [Candidatus Limnocylindrales bacterium]|nr:sodium:solute symporter family protein [Candidatus Limnocylindrales bacterium]
MMATHFSSLDWVIVVVYVLATFATGLYGRKFVGGIADFLVAGRELGTFIGIATLAATEIGTITFMYYAELGYKTGYASFINGLIAGVVMIFIGRTGFIVKRLRAMKLMTVPEFFEVKFSRRLRIFTGILVATGGILNMGVFLKVEGTFLAIISGIPLTHIKAVMTGILLLELVYTVLGGMVSIVITDFIQFVALSLGTILVTIWSIRAAGVQHMYDAVQKSMGAGGFSPITNHDYGWAYIFFQVLVWMAVHTCWQTTAMRTFSTKSPEISKKVFSWAGFIYLGRGMMPMMWGIAALALLGPNQNSLEAMPRMLATVLPSGVLGLVVAGMLAATMSVNSSYLLGWSSILAQDIILPLRRKPMSSKQQVVLNRVANLFVSIFVMIWGLWYTLPGPTYFYLNITASIYLSGTLVTVIAGLFWKRASTLGGYLAMAGGAVATIGFFFFKTPASYAGLGAFLLAAVGMLVGSLMGRPAPPRPEVATEPA